MYKIASPLLIMLFFALFNTPSWAIDVLRYANNLQSQNADLSSASTLLGIIDSCGNLANINDECVISGLGRVATEENNTYAKGILSDYMQATAEGNYNTIPECQTEENMQANHIIAHCILLMNYYALQTQDKDTALNQYSLCLQGGMQGLVYQGNIAAQYILGNLYEKRGLNVQAEVWKKALKMRKDTEAYALLMKCYR